MPVGARADDRESDQAIGIGQRQRAKQDRVNEREHCGVRADRQREHSGDAGREGGLLSDTSDDLPQAGERHERAYVGTGYNDSSLFS